MKKIITFGLFLLHSILTLEKEEKLEFISTAGLNNQEKELKFKFLKTEKDSIDEQLIKYILSHYKEWDVPSKEMLIPIRGYIKKTPKDGVKITEKDFTNLVSTNFHINTDFKISGNINTFSKTNMLKIKGEISAENKILMDLIEPSDDPEIPDLVHKFEGQINAEDMGYTAPFIEGMLKNASDPTGDYELRFSFEDFSGYRIYSSNEEVSGNVVYLNPRYMYYHVFGFAFFDSKPLVLNGKPLILKNEDGSVKGEYYLLSIAQNPVEKKGKPILSVVRKFTKPNNAFHLAGRKYCGEDQDFSDLELFSSDPNEQRWVSSRFKFMDDFYDEIGVKKNVGPETEMLVVKEEEDFDSLALKLIMKVREQGYLISREEFIGVLKKIEDSGQLEFLLKRIGGYIVNFEAQDVEMYAQNEEIKTALYNFAISE